MRLTAVHVTEFKSVRDSSEFAIGDITCLVGKNEAGKTALLQALYRLNPVVPEHASYSVIHDYPRVDVEDYRQEVERKEREPATVVEATFQFEDGDLEAVVKDLGEGVVTAEEFTLSKGYENRLIVALELDEAKAVATLVERGDLPQDVAAEASKCTTLKKLSGFLEAKAADHDAALTKAEAIDDETEKAKAVAEAGRLTESAAAQALRQRLAAFVERPFSEYVWSIYVKPKLPKFLYFDEYYQMEGQVNINTLKERQNKNDLLDSDRPMLGLIELARLNLDELLKAEETEELLSRLEGTGNHLSKQVLKYWSQNKHLKVRFEVREGRAKDPPGMQSGTNLWGRVYDSVHEVTTPLGNRSRGFVWFFSFLAWFSQQRKSGEPLVLLLDEPGLFLHAAAQGDLLRYIEDELRPHHQVIYTSHSPFMVDAREFGRVRIVQDRSMDAQEQLPDEDRGTKVLSDVLEADEGSLFPLQGALGYDIAQTLFVGPNSLIVEGASDLLYLQTMSALLREKGRTALSDEWTITPVGGADKVPTFVSLLGAQKGLRLATLIDIQKKDQQRIEQLYKKKLLKKKNVLTFAHFTGSTEADIEDMFAQDFYLTLVNSEFEKALPAPLSQAALNSQAPRILLKIGEYLDHHPMISGATFSHFRPARYLTENVTSLKDQISADTFDRFEKAFKSLNGLL